MTLLTTVHGRGTTAAKPDAASVPVGSLYYDTDLEKLQRSDGSAWEDCEGGAVTPGYPTASWAKLTKSGTQSITQSQYTAITFDGEVADTSSYHESVTNPSRLTAPVAGLYLVGGTVRMTGLDDTRAVIIKLYVNGAFVDGDGAMSLYASGDNANLSFGPVAPLLLDEGDYVEMFLTHSSAGAENADVSANGTSFWIVRLA